MLYYNGHGIKENFYIYKQGVAVGKVLVQSSYEPYSPDALKEFQKMNESPKMEVTPTIETIESKDPPKTESSDSLLMN